MVTQTVVLACPRVSSMHTTVSPLTFKKVVLRAASQESCSLAHRANAQCRGLQSTGLQSGMMAPRETGFAVFGYSTGALVVVDEGTHQRRGDAGSRWRTRRAVTRSGRAAAAGTAATRRSGSGHRHAGNVCREPRRPRVLPRRRRTPGCTGLSTPRFPACAVQAVKA